MLALAISHMVSGQWDVRAFGGPQFDDVVLEFNKETNDHIYETMRGGRTYATGLGWHVGTSATYGDGVLRLTMGTLLSHQELNAAYSYAHTYRAQGGNSTTEVNGDVVIRSLMLEFPIQMTLGRDPAIQFHLGVAPWTLLHVEFHDIGDRLTSSYNYASGNDSHIEHFDIRNNDLRHFTRNGISMNFGASTVIKRSFSIHAACSVSMNSIYREQQPFEGHHTFLRLSLGYVLFKTSDQNTAPDP